jgi:uncharacterized repeat protein (TIGR03803 family)
MSKGCTIGCIGAAVFLSLTFGPAVTCAATEAKAKVETLAKMTDKTGPLAAPLMLASDGNYYGASSGGTKGAGMVFRMTPAGHITVVHNFSVDKGYAASGLIQASDGALYGTAAYGGAGGQGVVFKITLDGKYTVLHSFSGTDGGSPFAELVQASDGYLYGTTAGGGANDSGSMFRISTTGDFNSIVSFDYNAQGMPDAPLLEADDGSFYGTTGNGGPRAYGALYRVTKAGVITILHSFEGGGDGRDPGGPLVFSPDHSRIFGVTGVGGLTDGGTIFTFDGKTYAKVFDFDTPDGSFFGPTPPALGADGVTFYGFRTTADYGTGLYSLSVDGIVHLGSELESILPQFAPPVLSADGMLIGGTNEGGDSGNGLIFEVKRY